MFVAEAQQEDKTEAWVALEAGPLFSEVRAVSERRAATGWRVCLLLRQHSVTTNHGTHGTSLRMECKYGP